MDGGGGDRGDSLHPGKCFSNINGSFLALAAAALLRGRCCLLSAQLNQHQQQKRVTRRDGEETQQDSPNQHKNREFHEINKLDFIATAIHLNYIIIIIITINQSSVLLHSCLSNVAHLCPSHSIHQQEQHHHQQEQQHQDQEQQQHR